MAEHPFARFLESFVPEVERKSKQVNQAAWILETTGSSDAADLKAALDTELRLMFNSAETYRNLLKWEKEGKLKDPILERQLNVLIRSFKQNQIAPALLREMSEKEAALAQTYANFRPELDGKKLSENELREILKRENKPAVRKKAWEASKKIGDVLAPQILALVELRNRAAKELGYADFFELQLELQEVDRKWLLKMLDDLAAKSDAAYGQMIEELETEMSRRFKVDRKELGPWAWSDPFGQEDPLDSCDLDKLVEKIDISTVCESYYRKMGFDVKPILTRSDMFERPGKNQHAFCMHVDRRGDVRTLNNVKPSIKWLETVLHELGHAVYELGLGQDLPWLLKEPPHMIPTEAMALIAGRQAYRAEALKRLIGKGSGKLIGKAADESLRRRQLIFSRWVLVMTAFESELYRNPKQDLNRLWWKCVEKYQKIRAPKRDNADWASKYHIGLAPVYYFSYLLGELFASALQEALEKETGSKELDQPKAGRFLEKKLFAPGNRWNWSELVRHATGRPLNPDAWLREFATC